MKMETRRVRWFCAMTNHQPRSTLIPKEVLDRKEDIMTTIKAFIKRHPVLTYFALAFAISWGGILFVVGPGGIPATPERVRDAAPVRGPGDARRPQRRGHPVDRPRLWEGGLSRGSLPVAQVAGGRALVRGGAPDRPARVHGGTPRALANLPEFLPGIVTTSDKATLLLFGIAAGLMVGIFEELGWTGFAIPRLRLRYGVLATGLIVGVLWGAWHILAHDFWASGSSSGGLAPAFFLPVNVFCFLVGQLPAFRVLMVWVYDRTGSLLVAMLMHASLTASTLYPPGPLAISGVALLIYSLVLAAALWVVVASVAVASGGHLSRQPLRRRVA